MPTDMQRRNRRLWRRAAIVAVAFCPIELLYGARWPWLIAVPIVVGTVWITVQDLRNK